jgi:hypothetical protein
MPSPPRKTIADAMGTEPSGFGEIAGLAIKLAVQIKNMEPCRRGPRQKSSRAWPAVRVGDDLD